MKTIHSTPLAVAYARSLLELATAQNQAEEVGQELSDIRRVVDTNPIFGEFLADPGISTAERASALGKIFRGRINPLLFNFLGVINENGRLRLLDGIELAYADLLDQQLGNVEVDVTTAQKLSPEDLERVREQVSRIIGKNAVVHQYVDDRILGGLVLRYQDKVIDASVRQQLKEMRNRLLAARRV